MKPADVAASSRYPAVRFWLTGIAAAFAVAAACALGLWQLDRAAQKEALQASIEARKMLPALMLPAPGATNNVASLLHRQAVVRGRWRGDDTVYLDNRQMHGRPGFYVLTPLDPEEGGPAVMVQRGWVPRNFVDRAAVPAIDTPREGLIEVTGRIELPPSKLLELGGRGGVGGAGASIEGASRIRQNLDLARYAEETRSPLRTELMLVQTSPPGEGLQRDWPQVQAGVAKHYGYAVQWFALAGLIGFLYVWFHIVRPVRGSRSRP